MRRKRRRESSGWWLARSEEKLKRCFFVGGGAGADDLAERTERERFLVEVVSERFGEGDDLRTVYGGGRMAILRDVFGREKWGNSR